MSPADVAQLGGDVAAYLGTVRDDQLDLLRRLVVCESPSLVPETQQEVLGIVGAELEDVGLAVQRVPGVRTGGHLVARAPALDRGSEDETQLVIGHCDTVWPLGTLDRMPVSIVDGRMTGPGVYDMKAGLTQIVFALRALREVGAAPALQPVVLVNSDEEIGSRESMPHIRRLAAVADRALVVEPSLGPSGRLKTARKGVGRFTVTARGRAAHAGLDPGAGASAILELSFLIQQLFALNDPDRGVTVNVGMIDGGLRPNVVAPVSSATVDVRVLHQEDAAVVEAAIRALVPRTPGVVIEVEGRIGRPPLERTERNRALWELARRCADALDLDVEEGTAGGGSDGNNTSELTATLDGLGAVGDGAHAEHEHIEVEPTLARTALLALLLAQPSPEIELDAT